ncbi:MAG: hypothetical protein CMO29_07940 [Tistrella sp.]|nr:hypothetical protein [Tistrella sp.]
MGSSGSGRLTDYPGSQSKGTGNEVGSGASGGDRCGRAFSCILEEVELCSYFLKHKSAPPTNTILSIIHQRRLFAVDANGESVGALPTKFNYIADCIVAGFTYKGRVVTSSSTPFTFISVDFAPGEP